MATLTVGPGKDYATIGGAYNAMADNDILECYFSTAYTSFKLMNRVGINNVTIQAATGYTPQWLTAASSLATFEGVGTLKIVGFDVGLSDNSNSVLFNLNPQTTTGSKLHLQDCRFSFGTGTPTVANCNAIQSGTTPIEVEIQNCSMAQTTNKFSTIMGINGASPKLGEGTLKITNSEVATNGLRSVTGNALFVNQEITKSFLRIHSSAGLDTNFKSGSTTKGYQSVFDGVGTATRFVYANVANTTPDFRSCYFIRNAAGNNAIQITNGAGTYFQNCAFFGNAGNAISSASTVTAHCLFGSNGADYAGGGTVSGTDLTAQTVTYTDIANFDYSPTAASDTIDNGVDMGFTTDIVGVSIPQGSAYDIGPFEFPLPERLLSGSVTGDREITITGSGDLTAAITTLSDWSVSAITGGATEVGIDSITIGTPNTTAIITVDADLSPRAQYSVETTSAEIEAGYRSVIVTVPSAGARMTQATFIAGVIVISADEATSVASDGASKWTIAPVGMGDPLTITDALHQGTSVGLSYSGIPTPGAKYLITTTAIEPDFEDGYHYIDGVVPLPDQDFTPEPFLPSMLSAIGKAISYATGTPQTILTADATVGATELFVETTLEFPATDGVIFINGVELTYTGKTSYSLTGVAWPTVTVSGVDYITATDGFTAGMPVACYSKQYSLQDIATNRNIPNRCTGKSLLRLANSWGLPVPLSTMSDSDIQDYLNERMYQGAGPAFAIFRTLRAVLRGIELNGTATVVDETTASGFVITDLIQRNFLVGRWVEINGRVAKILSVTYDSGTDTYSFEFVDTDGYMWQNPRLDEVGAGNSVSWRLLSFLFNNVIEETTRYIATPPPAIRVVDQQIAGKFQVHLFVGATAFPASYPVGYWLEDDSVAMPSDGRSTHNYLAADSNTIATADDRFLYLMDNYDFEVSAILSDLLPAGVLGEVIIY